MCCGILTACGGGGPDAGIPGGGEWGATTDVTLSPDPLRATWVDRESAQLVLTADIEPVPAGTLYPRLTADKPVIVSSATRIDAHDDGRLTITMLTTPGTPAGVYTGTMTLHLCSDAACTAEHPLNGNTVAYQFVVHPS